MLTYEFMKQVVVYTAFFLIIIAGISGWTYWICELLSFIHKKIKAHKEKKAAKQAGRM